MCDRFLINGSQIGDRGISVAVGLEIGDIPVTTIFMAVLQSLIPLVPSLLGQVIPPSIATLYIF